MRYLCLVYSLWICSANSASYSLLDVYQSALMQDKVLAVALSNQKAVQEVIEQAYAAYRPTLTFNAGISATSARTEYSGRTVPFTGGQASFESYTLNLNATQPIYRKSLLVNIDQAKLQVSQSDKQLYVARQDLMRRVTEAYFNVLVAQEKWHLIKTQKKLIFEQREQARLRFKLGASTIVDVNEAQSAYDGLLAQEIATQTEWQIAQQALTVIAGKEMNDLAPAKDNLPLISLQPMNVWLEFARDTMVVQIQEDAVRIAEEAVRYTQAGHFPTLDSVVNLTNNHATNSIQGFGSDSKFGTIGLQFQLPLYQGGMVNSQIRQAESNAQSARDLLEATRRQTIFATQSAYGWLSSSLAEISAYTQALSSSRSQLESTQLGYTLGVRNNLELLNAKQQLFNVQFNLLQARYNYLTNIIRLKSASGTVIEQDLLDINQQLELLHHDQP